MAPVMFFCSQRSLFVSFIRWRRIRGKRCLIKISWKTADWRSRGETKPGISEPPWTNLYQSRLTQKEMDLVSGRKGTIDGAPFTPHSAGYVRHEPCGVGGELPESFPSQL